MRIGVKQKILKSEGQIAGSNRRLLRDHGITALNLIGSPGSGKTSLIEAAHLRLSSRIRMAVIEGDLASDKDTRRLRALGINAVQINTGRGCHLTAKMVREALHCLPLKEIDLLIIENVGNLVCPANFEIGETAKIGLLSVPEGDDKPVKYPLLFLEAKAVVLNKIDLIPHTDFDRSAFYSGIKGINPALSVMEVSCRTGEGLEGWGEWLLKAVNSPDFVGI